MSLSTEDKILDNLWYTTFSHDWYEPDRGNDTCFEEMRRCAKDAEAGIPRAQEYWARFIAARMME